jgi:hypothetical protein
MRVRPASVLALLSRRRPREEFVDLSASRACSSRRNSSTTGRSSSSRRSMSRLTSVRRSATALPLSARRNDIPSATARNRERSAASGFGDGIGNGTSQAVGKDVERRRRPASESRLRSGFAREGERRDSNPPPPGPQPGAPSHCCPVRQPSHAMVEPTLGTALRTRGCLAERGMAGCSERPKCDQDATWSIVGAAEPRISSPSSH